MPVNWVGTDASETKIVAGSDLRGGILDGGGGVDTLELRDTFYPTTFDFTTLTTFQNIEVIRGVIEVAHMRFRSDQLEQITTIDSYDTARADKVMIVGSSIDLTETAFIGNLEITPETANAEVAVADISIANLIKATVRGVHAQIQTGGVLTQDQRKALFDRGIDKITDASGGAPSVVALALQSLQNDSVTGQKGTPILIDAGKDAVVAASSHLKYLTIKIAGQRDFFSSLDMDVSGRMKVGGTNADGDTKVFIDSVEIGGVYRALTDRSLNFTFNEAATNEQVQEVVRSIAYSTSSLSSTGPFTVEVTLQDVAGRKTTTTSNIVVGTAVIVDGTPPTSSSGNVLIGTSGSDVLKGGSRNDALKGMEGNDRLYGGMGKDTLTGGKGKDIFVFNTSPNKATNLDKITDFNVKDDTIWLDNAVFKKLGKGTEKKPGKLDKKFFTIGSKAKDKDDYLIYDNKKGVLFYDKDGSGSSKAIEITTLFPKLKLTVADFGVI